jgi:hypothetical protein
LTKKPPFIKPLFIGARAFIRAAKTCTPFAIYATPVSRKTTTSTNIPIQCKEFQDVFEKKNADILPEHRPYNCAIDLQKELNHHLVEGCHASRRPRPRPLDVRTRPTIPRTSAKQTARPSAVRQPLRTADGGADDCANELQDRAQLPFGPIYNLSQMELIALREH